MSEVKAPPDLKKALADAERDAMRFEESSRLGLDAEEMALAERVEDERRMRVKGRGDVQQILKVVEVRRTFYRILEMCGPYQLSFDLHSARLTDFNEGKRAIGIEILKMIEDANPGSYLQMINEHQSDLKAENERKRKEKTQ